MHFGSFDLQQKQVLFIRVHVHIHPTKSCLCFTLVEPEEVISRWYYKEKKKKKGLVTETKDCIPRHSIFFVAGIFSHSGLK